MFVTLTLGSYGRVTAEGVPVDPERYDYRRAALDALHFPKLVDRFWQNLRRCAGYQVQYFAAIEAQRRLAPHMHAAIRGTIPRQVLRQVRAATYHQLWWPAHDEPVYVDRLPVWTERGYADPTTGELLPTWDEALDALDADPEAQPAHVVRFGDQDDIQGLLAGSPGADRAIGYLCKYLPKDIATTHDDGDASPARAAHIDRLAEEVRWLPCAPTCANWLRYGVQPAAAQAGMVPGHCKHKAHDRANLGLGGRRVLVSRKWSGKTLAGHKADRAAVVRAALGGSRDRPRRPRRARRGRHRRPLVLGTARPQPGRRRHLRRGHRSDDHHPPALAGRVRGRQGRRRGAGGPGAAGGGVSSAIRQHSEGDERVRDHRDEWAWPAAAAAGGSGRGAGHRAHDGVRADAVG